MKDLMDFLEDASQEDSTVGLHFLSALNKGKSANDLHQMLVGWGYNGVKLNEITRLLAIFNTKARAKDAILETGY